MEKNVQVEFFNSREKSLCKKNKNFFEMAWELRTISKEPVLIRDDSKQ